MSENPYESPRVETSLDSVENPRLPLKSLFAGLGLATLVMAVAMFLLTFFVSKLQHSDPNAGYARLVFAAACAALLYCGVFGVLPVLVGWKARVLSPKSITAFAAAISIVVVLLIVAWLFYAYRSQPTIGTPEAQYYEVWDAADFIWLGAGLCAAFVVPIVSGSAFFAWWVHKLRSKECDA